MNGKRKLRQGKLYLLPSGTLVRIVAVNRTVDKVFVHSYSSNQNEAVDLDLMQGYSTPMMTIGEVAKMLGKSTATLRKYEKQGLIEPARKFKIGDGAIREIRLYTPDDVLDLLEFFIDRRGVGRPAMHNVSKIDKDKVKRMLSAKFEKE